nr:MAG TPA: hypothetical protein [Caudoviricetes sp.]
MSGQKKVCEKSALLLIILHFMTFLVNINI